MAELLRQYVKHGDTSGKFLGMSYKNNTLRVAYDTHTQILP